MLEVRHDIITLRRVRCEWCSRTVSSKRIKRFISEEYGDMGLRVDVIGRSLVVVVRLG